MRRHQAIRRGLNLLERLAPPLAVVAADRMWFTPPRPSRGMAAADEMALSKTTRIIVRVGHDDRPGFVLGDGPAVLLIHGWGGRAAQMLPLAESLAQKGFKVAAIDLPGHGVGARGRTDIFQMADGVAALADRVGSPEAVVAHSLGAIASQVAFAEAPPSAAVFLAPVLAVDPPLRSFATITGIGASTEEGLRRRLERFVGERWPDINPAAGDVLVGSRLLIIHDPADAQAPYRDASDIAAARPGTDILAADGLGHVRLLAAPETIRTVGEFLGSSVATDTGEPAFASEESTAG